MTKIFGIILVLSTFTSFSQTPDWGKDMSVISRCLPFDKYWKYSKVDTLSFTKELDFLARNTDTVPTAFIAVKLQQLLTKLGDSHTHISLATKAEDILPLHLFWFIDGLYVLAVANENKELLATKIISINNRNISEITDSLKTLIVQDNLAMNLVNIPKVLTSVSVLQYFGFYTGNTIIITAEDTLGRKLTSTIEKNTLGSLNLARYRPKKIPIAYKNERTLFWDEYNSSDSIYYIQYNKCWGAELEFKYGSPEKAKELPSFEAFARKVIKTAKQDNIKKIIIDLRFNQGGSSPQGTDFIRRIANEDKINKKGKLFVIIGRQTFSSAIFNTLDFINLSKAILVGESTSGRPNHYGEVRNTLLPESGYKLYYSTNYFEPYGIRDTTIVPTLQAPISFIFFREGIDPFYELVKSYQTTQ